jgi:hypothetical protein
VIPPRRQVQLAHAQHDVAARTRLSLASSSLENLRTSATRMSELR